MWCAEHGYDFSVLERCDIGALADVAESGLLKTKEDCEEWLLKILRNRRSRLRTLIRKAKQAAAAEVATADPIRPFMGRSPFSGQGQPVQTSSAAATEADTVYHDPQAPVPADGIHGITSPGHQTGQENGPQSRVVDEWELR